MQTTCVNGTPGKYSQTVQKNQTIKQRVYSTLRCAIQGLRFWFGVCQAVMKHVGEFDQF